MPHSVASSLEVDVPQSWPGMRILDTLRRWIVALASPENPPSTAVPPTGTSAPNATAPPLPSAPFERADALYQQHARAVLGYLCARLPTLADAEDALAEVFLAALRACATGEEPGIGWLIRVARRRVADYYRGRERAAVVVAHDERLATLPDDTTGPEQAVLQAETMRELLALVAALPDEQREALSLRFAAGLRSPQIAAILGKSDDATRALLSRALRRLRKELSR